MKKAYLFLLMLATYASAHAGSTVFSQNSWRWRNSDGTETSATWKAAQATPVVYTNASEIIRLRVEMFNQSTGTNGLGDCCTPVARTLTDFLQYSPNTTAGPWTTIGFEEGKAFHMAGSSAHLATQGEATTPQITGSSKTFSAGKVMVTDSLVTSTIGASGRTEIEWNIVGTPYTLPSTTYYFRQVRSSGTGTITSYASLTTGATLPVTLSNFAVAAESGKVRVAWSTASEQNNAYFQVQRSTDAATWTTINKVNSYGNASGGSYSIYDNGPPVGTVYYRLQQFDKNGSYSFSGIRSLKVYGTSRPVFSVYPNPSSSAIGFSMWNAAATGVQATLYDLNGKTVFAQDFHTVQPSALNRLNMPQPPRGIYLLRLKGDGFLETIKVTIL